MNQVVLSPPIADVRRHVPELALAWVTEHPDERWRQLDGTLCFADVSGFTALAERLAQRGRVGGEELVETLGGIFSRMLDVAAARGGGLLKFGGDALLLFFRGPDHALQAASAAIEMRDTLRRSYGAATSVGPLRLSMSVGLHAGPTDLFLVGESHRELILLGPAASAVLDAENLARAGEIVVSPATAGVLPPAATRDSRAGGLALRWRKPLIDAAGPVPALVGGTDAASLLLPADLCAYLGAGAPDPEHRVASIAFARLSGTDDVLARQGPRALADVLQHTVSQMQTVLVEEGIAQLAVDLDRDGAKVFLAAGVPFGHEDAEGLMLRALRRLIQLDLPLPLQIGVNRGHVFAAEVGTARRAAYSAMGDTTNTAARIAAQTPQGAIFAHPSVLDESLTRFSVTPAGPLHMKGKAAPQSVFEVGEALGMRQREGLDLDVFVGRESELSVLASVVARVREGCGASVVISGDPGVGKSRLLQAAVEALEPSQVLALRAEPYGANNPFRMFRDPLRRLLGIERDSPMRMREVLQCAVAERAADLLPWLSLLGDVLQIEVEPSAEVAALEPKFLPERTGAAVIGLLEAFCPGQLAVTVDDAHWSDPASRQLLGRLARACVDRPWAVLVGQREADESGEAVPCDEFLSLKPMPDADIRRIVELATEAAPPRPHVVTALVERAAGYPLFAFELVRTLREVGSLEALPTSLEAVISTQVDYLDMPARRILRHASVLGRSFSRSTLAGLLAEEGYTADADVLARLDGFLLADGGQRLRFRAGVVRDTIYAALSYRLRARLHRVAGHVLEAEAPDPDLVAESLALHFERGQDFRKAWTYGTIAGDRSAENYAHLEALHSYGIALDAARRCDDIDSTELQAVWTALGESHLSLGNVIAALDAYARAMRLVGDDALARAELFYRRSRARELGGAFSQALRDLTVSARLARESGSAAAEALLAQVQSHRAMIHFGQDRLESARAAASAALPMARSVGDDGALVRALNVLEISTFLLTGTFEGRYLQEALEVAGRAGSKTLQALARTNLGNLNAFSGQWRDAVASMRDGRDLYVAVGDHREAAVVSANIAEILINQRRADEAEEVLEAALRTARGLGDAEILATVHLQFARLRVAQQGSTDGLEFARLARDEFTRLGQTHLLLEAAIVEADARSIGGDPLAGLRELDAAIRQMGDSAAYLAAKTACARARALVRLRRYEDAESEIAMGLAAAEQQGLLYEQALLLDLGAAARRACGKAPDPVAEAKARAILDALEVLD